MTVPEFLLGRRAALTGALTLLAVAIVALAVLARVLLGTGTGTQAERLGQLAELEAEAALRPDAERALTASRAAVAAYPGLLHGDSDALTQADLQSDVKSIVEANGGEVRSASPLPASDEHGLRRIAIQYDVTLPLSKLDDLAYALESHTPYLVLSAVDIVAPAWPSGDKPVEPRIEARWTVSGFRKGGAK